MHRFKDDELSCYLDGEASDDLVRRIDLARASDPDLQGELDALEWAGESLRNQFGALEGQAPAYQEPEFTASESSSRQGGLIPGIGVGLAAGLAASVLFGTAPATDDAPDWARSIAEYQVLYTRETILAEGLGPQSTREQLARLDSQIEIDLRQVPELPGLQLKRAQILGYQEKPLLQIVYSDASGNPIALCLMPAEGMDTSPVSSKLEGMQAALWQSNGHKFILIGGKNRELIMNAANLAKATL